MPPLAIDDVRKERHKPGLSGRIAAAILYTALAAPPFLFGSRDPLTLAAWCALLGAGLIFAPTRRLQKEHLWLLAGIALLILCFGFVLHEQLSDHPWIAPFNPIWQQSSEALGTQLAPSVSIVKGEPFFALGHPLANILALALGVIVGVDSGRARRGVRVMAWAGVAYAIYGIVAFAFDPNEILWREKTAYMGSLTATFINRNTAATYFGSCAAVWFVLLMAAIRKKLPRGPIEWKSLYRHVLQEARGDILVRFVLLFICLSAMFMTASRGGVLISLGIIIMSFMIYFGRDFPRRREIVIALLICAAISLVLLQVLASNVSSRIDLQGLSDAGRLSTWHSTLRIIADNPWFGTGMGTFAEAYPAYRSDDISMQGRWGIGHSTPLELASDMGIPIAGIVALSWLIALVILGRACRGSRQNLMVPLSALAVSLIALLHSSIDFSLQIAGYSIVAFAVLGLGLSQAVLTRGNQISGRSRAKLARPVLE